jgi:hypoxanthine phosphoribosyltransferase
MSDDGMSAHTPLVSKQEIGERVTNLAESINRDYADRALDIVYALGGSSIFCADLVRCLTVPVRLHPIAFSAYPGASPSGEVRMNLDVAEPLHGRHVMLLEGIIVSGRTPRFVMDCLRLRQPASLALCALGVKRAALAVEIVIAYAGFEFGPELVVGYGVGEGAEKAIPFLTCRSNHLTKSTSS